MFGRRKNRGISSEKEPPPETRDDESFRQLIAEHVHIIEKQCYKKCGVAFKGESANNEADALYVEVLDKLKADNYKKLRVYDGRREANPATFLFTVVSTLIYDTFREKKGRLRFKERAERYGELGKEIFYLIFERGYTLADTREAIATAKGNPISHEEVDEIYRMIVGKHWERCKEVSAEELALRMESEEIEFPDPVKNNLDHSVQKRAWELLKLVISELGEKERAVIVMRYAEEPFEVREIAKLLGMTEGQIYRVHAASINKCCSLMEEKGFEIKDFLL